MFGLNLYRLVVWQAKVCALSNTARAGALARRL